MHWVKKLHSCPPQVQHAPGGINPAMRDLRLHLQCRYGTGQSHHCYRHAECDSIAMPCTGMSVLSLT